MPQLQINISDFFQLVGEKKEEVISFAAEKVMVSDLRYNILTQQEKETTITEILKSIDKNNFSVTGNKNKWETGWNEVFTEYSKTKKIESLTAKFSSRGSKSISRLNGEYIHTYSQEFHQNLYTAFHYWAIEKYFGDATEIFDIGCGTGENIKHLFDVYPEKKLHGLDWAQSSVNIVNSLNKDLNINVEGHVFDIFNPDYNLSIPEGSAIYTCESLEQVGNNFHAFLNFLLNKKPKVVVHFEPILEFYNGERLLDYLAIKYHVTRKYLNGYYTELINLQNEGKIRILHQNRIEYGGLYHDSSIIVWEIV